MARWQDFPVHADPRPLVLTGPTILFRGGFPTSEAKDAFLHGAIDGEPSVPHAVVEIFRRGGTPYSGARLVAIAATLDEATFDTDRGPRQLPAWRVEVDGVSKPFLVLDPGVLDQAWPSKWDPEHGGFSQSRAWLHRDGQLLTYQFIGS